MGCGRGGGGGRLSTPRAKYLKFCTFNSDLTPKRTADYVTWNGISVNVFCFNASDRADARHSKVLYPPADAEGSSRGGHAEYRLLIIELAGYSAKSAHMPI